MRNRTDWNELELTGMGERFDAPRPGLVERQCVLLGCGKKFWVYPSSTDKTCKNAHGYGLIRRPISPRTNLHKRVLRLMYERDLSYAAVGREIGVTGECVSRWFRTKNAALGL